MRVPARSVLCLAAVRPALARPALIWPVLAWPVLAGPVLAGLALAWLALILATAPQALAQDPYRLQPGDVVEITVIEDPNLNRRVLVGPDGRISLPLAGSVVAAGRTLAQVQSSVQSGLSGNFVRPPTVSASLVALGPPPLPELDEEEIELFSVYVLGEVLRPGRYDYESEKPISVLQALALAGGPGIFADRDAIQIRNIEEGEEQVRIFDYDAVEEGLGAALAATLSDGAIIVVPERGLFD
jgi:polysaccharide biosynthesis/export protein